MPVHRGVTVFLLGRYLLYLCFFISKSVDSLGSYIQKDCQATYCLRWFKISEFLYDGWLKARKEYWFLISYYSNLSGKLGGFAQENNTIDSGELDIGRRAIQEVPPGIFWRSQLFIDQPQFLKFNISLQKDALIGVYGRKGLPPSHTQVRTACIENCELVSFCISFLSQDYILYHFADD